MYKNEKLQIRINEELLEYVRDNCDNISRFIREAMRAKIKADKKLKKGFKFVEVRARTPYIYFAKLIKVVDGDTLLVSVDLGFFVNIETRLRLSNIDCPSIETNEGKKAASFIENELTDANLLIQVKKKGRYGRYLSLVYYSKAYDGFEEILRHGKLLNEVLVMKGLARKY